MLIFCLCFSQVEEPSGKVQKNDSIQKVGNIGLNISPVVEDSISPKKEKLQGILDYDSEEQLLDIPNNKAFLLREAVVKYLDMEILADYIEIDLKTGDIYALGKTDSTGTVTEPSIFKQENKEYEYGSFTYNINTKRGKAYNVRTEESIGSDKGVIYAGVVKQYNDSVSGLRKLAYTTDTYFIEKKDTIADYYLEAQVGKLIRGKTNKIITGPIVMKIYDIVTPFALPFAFLPSGSKRSAGILLPSFGERENTGFYLEGLGLYLPIGEYVDLAFSSDIYTKGSLGLHALSNYKVRYKYAGNFNFDWYKTVSGIKGLPSYNKNTGYNLSWSHRQDNKANPNLTFNASVNLQNSKYYQNTLNSYGIRSGEYARNNVNSSIALSKNWPSTPFSSSLFLNHSQNLSSQDDNAGNVVLNLPTFTFNMSSIYPFAKKNTPKKGMLQSIGMTYNLNLQNKINTTDDSVFKKEMFDDSKTGAKHSLQFNTGTTLLNYLSLNLSANFNEVWSLNSVNKYYDNTLKKVITDKITGFKSYRIFGTSASINTTLYGTKIFGTADDDKRIKAIRHVIIPNVSFNYTPDFSADSWGYYDSYVGLDGLVNRYSIFEGTVFPLSGSRLQENVSFGFANNIELKVRDRSSTSGIKKVKLLETFDISSAYNFAADSMNLSEIKFRGSTNLFNRKMSVNFSGRIDPYDVVINSDNPRGIRINRIGRFGLDSYSITLGYSLDQAFFGKRELDYDTRGRIRYEDFYFDENRYAMFMTPWTLKMDLSHVVSRDYSGSSNARTILALRGSISPSPHWAVSGRANYDFQKADFANVSFSFSRDLRSFVLDFTMNPIGPYKYWNFFIGIKANFLRDALKYEEKSFRSYNNNL